MDTKELDAHRRFFAQLLAATAGLPEGSALEAAFASTPREEFLGPPPWRLLAGKRYLTIPPEHPSFVYYDVPIPLRPEGNINNGQPTLHAVCINALALAGGETVVHIGAGSGYYTTILAKLIGPNGRLHAYEIETDLAERARKSLAAFPEVQVHAVSGTERPLPECDALYVNAAATGPLPTWLDVLRNGGRLLFPLQPDEGPGVMLLVTRTSQDTYDTRILSAAVFISCQGARHHDESKALSAAIRRGRFHDVKSLRRNGTPDDTAWCVGRGWWLSTAAVTPSKRGPS